jgi:hypothetical protein
MNKYSLEVCNAAKNIKDILDAISLESALTYAVTDDPKDKAKHACYKSASSHISTFISQLPGMLENVEREAKND